MIDAGKLKGQRVELPVKLELKLQPRCHKTSTKPHPDPHDVDLAWELCVNGERSGTELGCYTHYEVDLDIPVIEVQATDPECDRLRQAAVNANYGR